ncbi:MAG: SGNH/GDSL hydrolase family protein [Opitutales bacterium]
MRANPYRIWIFLAFVFAPILPSQAEFHTPKRDEYRVDKPVETETDALPRVLLIGDSIMGGYFKVTQQLLSDEAAVFRHPGNAGDTRNGIKKLDQWLGDAKWDVIHFNWGLHDLCYRHPEATVYGHRDKINGTVSVPIDAYAENLEKLVLQLKKTGAILVFATTTRIPEGEAGRFAGDEIRYNQVALPIMEKHDIAVNDLYTLSKHFGPKMYVKPGDVHHTGKANKKLAEAVAKAILKQLD